MKRTALILFTLATCFNAFSSHIQGGNITYDCLGGNQYEVTLTMFFDCGTYSINTSGYSQALTVTNDCGLANPALTVNWDAANSNIEVSQLCGAQIPNSECAGGTQPGVWQATWTGIITLPAACNSWHFWYSTCCWNTNTNTPGTPGQLYHTTLNNMPGVGGCDDSPVIAGQQIPYLCVNQVNTYSIGASDPNGNNITYSLVPAQDGTAGSAFNVSYNGGYSGTAPIPGMTINPATGLITVNPNATGNYIVQVNITTYNAAGQIISVVSHQFQIVVVNCTNQIPAPPAGGVTGLSGQITSPSFNVVNFCAGQNGCFNVTFTDPDPTNILTVTSNVTTALPGSTVTITGTNPATAQICWTPPVGTPPNASLTFTAEDNACPITGINSFNVDVNVLATCCNPPNMTSTPVCAGGSTGSVTATGFGSAPFDYVWVNTGTGATVGNFNNLPGASTVNNLPAGTYQVTVTDNNGCVQTNTVVITANPQPTVTVPNATVCAGTASTLTATPSVAGGTYSWAPGGQTTQSITVTPGTTTTYTVTYNLNGCTTTDPGTVTVNPVPTVAVPNATICAGTNATLTATSNPTGGTFSWAPGGQTTASITVSPAATTTYTVTYTLAGCTATDPGTVTVNPQPTVTVPNASVCAGTASTLTATPSVAGGTYSWAPGGQTTQSITVTPGTTTTYTVTYSLNGCTTTDPGTVTVNPVPTVAVPDATICAGTNTTLTATPNPTGGTFSWAPGGQTTASITVSPAATTTYTVTYTLAGCTATDPGTVTVNPQPTVAVNNVTVCPGTPATLTATPSVAGGTFSWTPGGQTTQSITVTPGTTTTYTVTYSLNGCTAIGTGIVTIGGTASVAVNSTTICAGQNATITATPGTTGGTYNWAPGGQTTQSITVSPATTTTYTVTYNLGGCTGTGTGTVTVNPVPTLAVNSTSICPGNSATLTATPNPGGGTFSWAPGGQTTASITVAPAATTTYTATYSLAGCTVTGTGTVTLNANPPVNVNNATVCNGQSATLTATSGTGTGTYLWTPGGQTTASITVAPGVTTTYSVTYTENGCTGTGNGTVTVSPLPTIGITNTAVCAGTSGTLTSNVNPAGGTYSWAPGGQTTANLTDAPAITTVYTLTYTSPAGCTNTGAGTITVNALPTVAVNNTSICAGGNATLTATPNPIGGAFSWTPGGQTTASINVSPVITTTYTVTYTLNGCVASGNGTVSMISNPVANFSPTSVCVGVPTQFTDMSSPGVLTWDYDFGDGSPINNNQNPIHTYAAAGTYNATLTVGLSGCTGTATIPVVVNPSPQLSYTITPACPTSNTTVNNTSTITTGTISTWNWTMTAATPATSNTQNPAFTYSAGGTYTVTLDAISDQGCTATLTQTVDIPYMPLPDFSFTQVCQGNPTSFTDLSSVTGGTIAGWTWIWGDGTPVGTTQNPTHTYAAAGTYVVTMVPTTNDGCTGASVTYNVDVYTQPLASFTVTDECLVNAVVPNNTSTLAGTYSWNFGDGTALDPAANPTHIYTTPGTYTITLDISSGTGCTSTATQTVNVFAMPVASFNNTDVCDGLAMPFIDASSVNGGSAVNSWLWTFGDGNSSSLQSPSNAYASPGTYNVTLNVITTDGCTGSITQAVDVFATPTVNFTPNDVCLGVATQFQNLSTVSQGTITSYTWNFANGNTSTQTNPTQTYAAPGSYNVQLTATTGNGCTGTSTQLVNVHALPVVNFSADSLAACSPLCVNFTDNSTVTGGSVTSWAWSMGDGVVFNTQNPTHCYTNGTFNTLTFDVTLTVTSNMGCTSSQTVPSMLSVYAIPNADFIFSPQPTSILEPTITFVNTTLGGTSYTWDFGDGNGSTDIDPIHEYAEEGTYHVTLYTVNQFGCADQITHDVIISPEFLIYVPNAFTPDGDGTNDIFVPVLSGFDTDDYSFMIFNRWGDLIFSTEDPGKGWDGKHKDVRVKQDTYVWKVKVKDRQNGERGEFYGHVSILY